MPIKNLLKSISIILLQLVLISSALAAKITKLEPKQAPDEVEFYDEEGNKHFLNEFEENLVLLVFWASWCSACAGEIPALDILQKDFRKLPFRVVAVSEDFQGIDTVRKYFKTHEVRNLKIYHDDKNQLFKAFDVVGTPSSFLINQDGKIVVSFVGSMNWFDEEVRNIIMTHLPAGYTQPKNSYKPQDLNRQVNQPAKKEGEFTMPK